MDRHFQTFVFTEAKTLEMLLNSCHSHSNHKNAHFLMPIATDLIIPIPIYYDQVLVQLVGH